MKEPLNEELVYQLLEQNLTQAKIAEQLGCPLIRLQRWLRKNNISTEKRRYSEEIKNKVLELWNNKVSEKDIAQQVSLTVAQVRSVKAALRKKQEDYCTKAHIKDEIISNNQPLFWYLVGIISSDGHIIANSDSICIFQNDYKYLSDLKNILESQANIYSRKNENDIKCYTLRIHNSNLYKFFIQNNFDSDKRYTAPFLNNCPNEYLKYYLRGLFDGDGCLSYRYISGRFEGKIVQITSSSKIFAEGLKNKLNEIGFNTVDIQEKVSAAQNEYYDIKIDDTENVLKFCQFIYSGDFKFCLKKKYIKYYKLIELMKLDSKINDIVDTL